MRLFKFTLTKNYVFVALGVFYIIAETYNSIKTTGLINTSDILKSGVGVWLGFQSLLAHQVDQKGNFIPSEPDKQVTTLGLSKED